MRHPDRQRWLERAQWIAALLGFVALATLVVEFGFFLEPAAQETLERSNHWILRGFLGLLAFRLIISPQRLSYLLGHRLEYALGCVVAALTLLSLGVGQDAWFQWEPALESTSGTVTRLYLGISQGLLAIFSVISFARASTASNWRVQPARVVVLSFLVTIALGAGALMLPRAAHEPLSFTEAFFTSTSAVCVTGLSVIDPATELTRAGQVILLVFIQIGGLGIMTLAGCVVALFGGAFGMRQRLVLRDLVEPSGVQIAKQVLMRIALMTFAVEALGAAFLYWQWAPLIGDAGERLWQAVFHSISAFCNAGFSVLPQGLMTEGFSTNAGGLGILCLLVVLGGTGYPALADLSGITGKRAQHHRLSLQTRMVLGTHLGLLALTFGVLLLFEGPALRGFEQSVMVPLVQAVMPRTAGFQTIDLTVLQPASVLFILLMMWVGGSPGSTAGGLKVTTVWVVGARLWAMVRGRTVIKLRGREIDDETCDRAMAVTLLSLGLVSGGTLALATIEEIDLLSAGFEVVSALSTVGLSLNTTPGLGEAGRWLVICLMFVGRLGILAVLWSLFYSEVTERVRRPRENVSIF